MSPSGLMLAGSCTGLVCGGFTSLILKPGVENQMSLLRPLSMTSEALVEQLNLLTVEKTILSFN